MVVGAWRQSFERAPRYRRGRRSVCAMLPGRASVVLPARSTGSREGRETVHPIAFGRWAVSSSHLKAVRTGFVRVVSKDFFEAPFVFRPLALRLFGWDLSGWFRKKSFRSSLRVLSSLLTNGAEWSLAVHDQKILCTR